MAAAYANGISSSPTNLLTTLVSFLVSQGWTSDSSASEGSGWRAHLHKSGIYVNLRAAMNEQIWPRTEDPDYWHDRFGPGYGIGFYLGTGYSGGSEWYEQAGGPVRAGSMSVAGAGINLPSGAVAGYHIFDDGADNIIVVVERSPGIFCHFGFGLAMAEAGQPEDFAYFFGSSSAAFSTQAGDLPGGEDNYGINLSALPPMSSGNREYGSISGVASYVTSCAFVRVDAATFADRWISNGCSMSAGSGYSGRYGRCSLNANPDTQNYGNAEEFPGYKNLLGRIHQTAFAGSILLPLHWFTLTDPGARWAPIGYAPSIYWNEAVGHGYAAGDIYAIGGVNYMIFPHFAVLKGA